MGMAYAHFLDQFELPTLFFITLALMLVFLELGFIIGRRTPAKVVKAQTSQVRAIMGAGLGLTAFLLAFTFSIAQNQYQERVMAMVEEARMVRAAFLQADVLPPPQRDQARDLLHEYLVDRIEIVEQARAGNLATASALLQRSEEIQAQLWGLTAAERLQLDANVSRQGPFSSAVLGIIDAHVARIEASLLNRIATIIWVTLYLTAALSMLVMGYQAGLVTRRSPVATITLALVFSAVMMLITDQDRPVSRLFKIDNHVLIDLRERMETVIGQPRPAK